MHSSRADSCQVCEPLAVSSLRVLSFFLGARFWLQRDPKRHLKGDPRNWWGRGFLKDDAPLGRLPVLPFRYHRPATRRGAGAPRLGARTPALQQRRLQRRGRAAESRRRRWLARRSIARTAGARGRGPAAALDWPARHARLGRWRRLEPRCAPCARSCASCATPPAVPIATAPPIGTCSRPSARTGYVPPSPPRPCPPGSCRGSARPRGRLDRRSPQVTSEKLCRAQQELHFQAATYLCLLRSVREHEALHREYHGRGERSPQEVAGLVGFRLPQQPGGKG